MHCSHNGGHPLNGELQRRLALVIANFRPKRIRGVAINALLLVAYREVGGHSTVKLLAPHAALLPGERVCFTLLAQLTTRSLTAPLSTGWYRGYASADPA